MSACKCPLHTPQDRNSAFVTAPDMSVSVTNDEAMRALELFDMTDWETLESGLPKNATDSSGAPLDRHNRNIRLLLLAESIQFVRSGQEGAGVALMDNPYYEQYVNLLLDAYDKTAEAKS